MRISDPIEKHYSIYVLFMVMITIVDYCNSNKCFDFVARL